MRQRRGDQPLKPVSSAAQAAGPKQGAPGEEPADHHLGARRIALTTHAKDERAIRCYLACGFVEEGRPRKAIWPEGKYADLVEMSLLREGWQARPTSHTAPAPTGG
ncbi:MAG TPA: GNAT family protein [Caldilineaceae bacterium]|nr:GNAT family protein [Caldilineaceae bacterium]